MLELRRVKNDPNTLKVRGKQEVLFFNQPIELDVKNKVVYVTGRWYCKTKSSWMADRRAIPIDDFCLIIKTFFN